MSAAEVIDLVENDAGLWVPARMPTGREYHPARAARLQRYFERVLVHTKGRWARRPFRPHRWQLEEILWPLAGVVRLDDETGEWVRTFTLLWIELARKNGKSDILAGLALYLTTADGEEAAEVYGAAKNKKQAGVVFAVALRMCQLSPVLARWVNAGVLRIYERDRRIVHVPSASFYQVIAADADAALGTNPHGVLFDEVLTQPNRELWDALKTGQGTRVQPLMAAATTAGNDALGLASEEHLWSERVAANPDLDPSRLVFARNTPRDADWRDEAQWQHANPALSRPGQPGFLRLETLRDEAREAEGSPAKLVRFRQFRLNQWVRRSTKWLDMDAWDECAGEVGWEDLPAELDGEACWAGLDMASSADFAAWVLVFGEPGGITTLIPRLFLPRAAVERRSNMGPMLRAWEDEGALIVTDGQVLDEDVVVATAVADAAAFRLELVRFDRWGANNVTRRLGDDDIEAKGIAQTTGGLNAASKELEVLLGSRKLRHGGHPVLGWMAGNANCFTDGAGNIKPDRKNSADKIDGVMATVMGLAARAGDEEDDDVGLVIV